MTKTAPSRANLYVPFVRVDDEERMVYGYATTEALDSHGEIVSKKAIRKAWEDYMKFANVREMHQPSAVGVTKEYEHDDTGTLIGVKVIDDRAWKFVKEGVYKGFSIGGRVVKRAKNIIEEIILSEISLVDRPACPEAVFNAVKFDDGLVDNLVAARSNINDMKKSFVEIGGIKYVEDPANPGTALLNAQNEPEVWDEEVHGKEEGEASEAGTEGGEAGAEAGAEGAGEGDATVTADAGAEAGADATATADAGAETGAEGTADAETGGEAGADAGAVVENAAPSEAIGKDTMGVITLAGALDHLSYIKSMFEMNGKATDSLEDIIKTCKDLIAVEAKEKEAGVATEDLAKAMGPVMAEAMKNALAPLSEKVESLVKDVEGIKTARISPRPSAAVVVEKGFDSDSGEAKSFDEASKHLVEVRKEVDSFANEMRSALERDPSRAQEFMMKSAELHTKLTEAKRAVTEAQTRG